MEAVWNSNAIAAMSREENLLNLCRRFEQEHVDWKRPCTYLGCAVCTQWPAIGELGRYRVEGVELQFVTTHNRRIRVLDATGKEHGRIRVQPGMAARLHLIAQTILSAQTTAAAA